MYGCIGFHYISITFGPPLSLLKKIAAAIKDATHKMCFATEPFYRFIGMLMLLLSHKWYSFLHCFKEKLLHIFVAQEIDAEVPNS